MREVKLNFNKMLMDSKETSANAERYPLFCHADKSARNDRKKASFPPQDFFKRLQIFLSTKSKNTYRILGFLMRNRGFQAIGKGVTLGGNDRRQSRRIHDLSQKDKIPQRLENA